MQAFVLWIILLMPSSCDFTWSDELDTIIREEAAIAGVPLDLGYTYVGVESGFNPNAHRLDDIEDSVGLLQLNRRAGQGVGYTVEELKDPRFNLRIGFPYIARAFQQTWSTTITPYDFIWLVSIRSGHPGEVSSNDPRIVRTAQIWGCFFPAAGVVGPGGLPSTTTGPGPAVALAGGMAPTLLFLLFPGGAVRSFGGSIGGMMDPRTVMSSLSPGGIIHRLQATMNPSALLPGGGLISLARPRVRLPARHRPPRR